MSTHGPHDAPHGDTFAPQGPGSYATGQPSGSAPAPAEASGGGAPEPPRKSWFARHKILTALLAVVGVVVLANVVGGGGEGTDTAVTDSAAEGDQADAAAADDTESDAAPVEQEGDAAEEDGAPDEAGATDGDTQAEGDAGPAGAAVGDPVRDGAFEFTVTSVETGVASVGDEYVGEEAQGQFVLVDVQVSNIGDEPQTLFGDNQTLIDEQGREHSANTMAGIYLDDNDTFVNEINPGNTVEGTIVFDIPTDAVPTSLELHDSLFSGGVSVSLQ